MESALLKSSEEQAIEAHETSEHSVFTQRLSESLDRFDYINPNDKEIDLRKGMSVDRARELYDLVQNSDGEIEKQYREICDSVARQEERMWELIGKQAFVEAENKELTDLIAARSERFGGVFNFANQIDKKHSQQEEANTTPFDTDADTSPAQLVTSELRMANTQEEETTTNINVSESTAGDLQEDQEKSVEVDESEQEADSLVEEKDDDTADDPEEGVEEVNETEKMDDSDSHTELAQNDDEESNSEDETKLSEETDTEAPQDDEADHENQEQLVDIEPQQSPKSKTDDGEDDAKLAETRQELTQLSGDGSHEISKWHVDASGKDLTETVVEVSEDHEEADKTDAASSTLPITEKMRESATALGASLPANQSEKQANENSATIGLSDPENNSLSSVESLQPSALGQGLASEGSTTEIGNEGLSDNLTALLLKVGEENLDEADKAAAELKTELMKDSDAAAILSPTGGSSDENNGILGRFLSVRKGKVYSEPSDDQLKQAVEKIKAAGVNLSQNLINKAERDRDSKRLLVAASVKIGKEEQPALGVDLVSQASEQLSEAPENNVSSLNQPTPMENDVQSQRAA